MNAPSASLTNRLRKLLPMLATNHDGEILATVRAISGALASEGFDFHDLAASLSTTLAKREAISSAIAPPPSFDKMTHFERLAWLDALRAVDWLTPYERERVIDVRNRVMCGVDYRLTSTTKRKIDALIARAEGMGVRP